VSRQIRQNTQIKHLAYSAYSAYMLKILFTGGGTLGSVTPLLALAEELRRTTDYRLQTTVEMLWIGTRKGPERVLVNTEGIKFFWLWAPKLRRYFDVRNIGAPVLLMLATLWAGLLLLKLSFYRRTKLSFERPDVIVTAGGFVGVPIAWAAWWLRIPVLLHNQDVRWSLANKLVAPVARKIIYALPGTVPARWKKKAVWTGNPVRSFIFLGKKDRCLKMCGFTSKRPTILVLGGGTGASRLNEIVSEALPELTQDYQVIHLTGKGRHKKGDVPDFSERKIETSRFFVETSQFSSHYCALEFAEKQIADLFAAADLVITRAGMGTLSELAALGKPMIIVPIPKSHQMDNARYFEKHSGAIVLDQEALHVEKFIEVVSALLKDSSRLNALSKQLKTIGKPGATEKVAEEILQLV